MAQTTDPRRRKEDKPWVLATGVGTDDGFCTLKRDFGTHWNDTNDGVDDKLDAGNGTNEDLWTLEDTNNGSWKP